MSYLFESIGEWLYAFFPFLLRVLPYWFGAWLMTLLVLLFSFKALKPRSRSRVLKFDEAMNHWARALRYKLRQADAALEPNTPPSERHLLTWFFRFWTNFASAPSLSFWSLFLPFWAWHRALPTAPNSQTAFVSVAHWVLPGVCYAGSMLLSFVLKRVFKRVRPPREGQAFGYKLKDPSFPSGHSLTSFCFWLMLAVMVCATGALPFLGALLFALFALSIPLLTGWSRIYLGVHFPSDVVGGYFIGLVWCVAFLLACPFFLA